MKIGILFPQSGQQATRTNIIQMARNAENEGLDSLWVFERLLWPINPQTPYPVTPDGSLPIEYQNVFDPLETLTYVAANTRFAIYDYHITIEPSNKFLRFAEQHLSNGLSKPGHYPSFKSCLIRFFAGNSTKTSK
jgi:hypothetical protein